MSGLPKQLGSANLVSSMKMPKRFGLSLIGSSAAADSRPAETAKKERLGKAHCFIVVGLAIPQVVQVVRKQLRWSARYLVKLQGLIAFGPAILAY
jgi:ABC-type iron transport system FetAB permease component